MSVRSWLQELGNAQLVAADNISQFETLMTKGQIETAEGYQALFEAAQLVALAGDPRNVWDSATQYEDDTAIGRTITIILASFSVVRIEFAARPDAIEARELLASLADSSYQVLGEQSADVLAFSFGLVGSAVSSISSEAATLSPVLNVETGIPLPSSLLAYDLYGDASRGEELVDRNKHGAPMFMPTVFEAVIE